MFILLKDDNNDSNKLLQILHFAKLYFDTSLWDPILYDDSATSTSQVDAFTVLLLKHNRLQ